MTDLSTTDTVADHADDTTEIDETYGGARIEWGTGDQPSIIWNEHMQFHNERLGDGEHFGHYSTMGTRTQEVLQGLLPVGFECAVQWSDQDEQNGHPFLELTVWRTEEIPGSTPVAAAYGMLWPAIATLFNVTDPGTFNSPYLFSTLAIPATTDSQRARLEYLRGEIEAESISTGELIELQGLAEFIAPGDVQLLEAAGVPEYPQRGTTD